MFTHKIVNGVRVDLTSEEIAELEANATAYVPVTAPPAQTKEELLAQLNALSAKIQALE